tara:strand:- start:3899 stop:4213 length:315 start_codon:yes stop_codon:yes gene_type:complete
MMEESNYLLKRGLTMSVIQGLLMEGFTLPEIAKELNIRPERLAREYKPIKKKYKYFDNITPKKVDEGLGACSFTFDGVYTWDRLSQSEIEAYNDYNKKNHAYYV